MKRTLMATLACAITVLALPLLAWAAPCGNITKIGCCVGSTAKFCNNGSLVTKDCLKDTKYGPACGWATGLKGYGCNKTVTTDPAGKNPRDCSKLPDGGSTKLDAGTPKKDSGSTASCGNVTKTGCCQGSTSKYCNNGKLITKDCTKDKTYGPNCGWVTKFKGYACNKTATKDPSGKAPRECSKLPDGGAKFDYGTKKDTGTTAPCGTVTKTGCCQGSTSKYCNNGKLVTKDCTKDTKYGPACGWVTAFKGYACNKTATKDPSGKAPRECSGSTKQDTGTTTKQDTGSTTKQDTGSTAKQDGGGTTGGDKEDEGCSCGMAGQPGQGALLLLTVLGMLLVWRRRRG